MRQYARPTPLSRLSFEARLIYTAFALFMLLGYASSLWLYVDDEMDLSPKSARTYYLGSDERPDDTTAGGPALDLPDDGPAMELPGDLDEPATSQASLRFEKPARQVIETFHFHLFSMSVCYLIIAHLFMMGGLPQKFRVLMVVLSGFATLVHVLTPVLIRFVGPSFAALMGPSALLLGITWLFMTLNPVWEMWRLPLPGPKPTAP